MSAINEFPTIDVIVLHSNKFDNIIRKTYGHMFYFEVDMEAGNDTDHMFLKVGDQGLDKWEIDELDAFKDTGDGCMISRLLLEDLARNGIIPKGNYIIRVMY